MNKAVLVVALSSALVACGGSGGSGSKDAEIVLPPVEAKAAKLDQEASYLFAEAALYESDLREQVRELFNMSQFPRNSSIYPCTQGGEIVTDLEGSETKATVNMQFIDCREGNPVVVTSGAIKIVAEDKNSDSVIDYASASYLDYRISTEDTSYGIDFTNMGSLVFTRQSANLYQERANTQVINNILNETVALENVHLTFNSSQSNVVPVAASGKLVSTKYGSVELGYDADTEGVTFTGDNSKLTVTRAYDSYYSDVVLDLDVDNDGLIDHRGETNNFNEDSANWLF
ncbi:hypothetical protein [Motilimonas eburnea]|uniref:hypothetical protein n=1 Tax=Motilimonas eburnea TaxID=1737488 RepID=UPI001E53822E|nr:hypothetical protein [Motilimonas eburnea]MCE2572393.1 hypothetical protein [Motilimonas eburnea]